MGGVAAIAAAVRAFICVRRRRRSRSSDRDIRPPSLLGQQDTIYTIEPFTPMETDDPNKAAIPEHPFASQRSNASLSVMYSDNPVLISGQSLSTVDITSDTSVSGDGFASRALYPPTMSGRSDSTSRSVRVVRSMSPNATRTRGVDPTRTTQVLMAKQTLLNEELRTQVDNLQRQMQSIREARENVVLIDDTAPPSYF